MVRPPKRFRSAYPEVEFDRPVQQSERTSLEVVLVAKNKASAIEEVIASSLAAAEASGRDFRVLVFDDNSTDDTVTLAKRFPVRVFRVKKQLQTYSAMAGVYAGIEMANADYVYVCDGDVSTERSFLAAAADYLDAHPDVGLVRGTWGFDDENGISIRKQKFDRSTEQKAQPLGGPGLFRAAVVQQEMPDPALHCAADIEWGIRMRGATRVAYLDVPMCRHVDKGVITLKKYIRKKYDSGIGIGQSFVRGLMVDRRVLWPLVRQKPRRLVLIGWLFLVVLSAGTGNIILGAGTILLFLLMLGYAARVFGSVRKAGIEIAGEVMHAVGVLRGICKLPRVQRLAVEPVR